MPSGTKKLDGRWTVVGNIRQEANNGQGMPKFQPGYGPRDWGAQWRLTRRENNTVARGKEEGASCGQQQYEQQWIGMSLSEAECLLKLTHSYGRNKIVFLTYSMWRKMLWMLPHSRFCKKWPSYSDHDYDLPPPLLPDLRQRYPLEEQQDNAMGHMLGHMGDIGRLDYFLPTPLLQPNVERKKEDRESPTAPTAGGKGGGSGHTAPGQLSRVHTTRPLSTLSGTNKQRAHHQRVARRRLRQEESLKKANEERASEIAAEKRKANKIEEKAAKGAGGRIRNPNRQPSRSVQKINDRRLFEFCEGCQDDFKDVKERGGCGPNYFYDPEDLCSNDYDAWYAGMMGSGHPDDRFHVHHETPALWRFLITAIESGQLHCVQALCLQKEIFRVNPQECVEYIDQSLLRLAVGYRQLSICEFLLTCGGAFADPLVTRHGGKAHSVLASSVMLVDPSTLTPSWGVPRSSLQVARMLVEHGASIESAEKEDSLMYHAIDACLTAVRTNHDNVMKGGKNKMKRNSNKKGNNKEDTGGVVPPLPKETLTSLCGLLDFLALHGADVNYRRPCPRKHALHPWTDVCRPWCPPMQSPLQASEGYPELQDYLGGTLGAKR